jgi:hypothetical protein
MMQTLLLTGISLGILYGFAIKLAEALQQQAIVNDNILTLLIQIPVVAAFIWFTLQLAKMQQANLSAHQATLDKTQEAHVAERLEMNRRWQDWHTQANTIFLNFLAEEREHRRALIATISVDILNMEATLQALSQQMTSVEEALRQLPIVRAELLTASEREKTRPRPRQGESEP